jgi:hypothetical protein
MFLTKGSFTLAKFTTLVLVKMPATARVLLIAWVPWDYLEKVLFAAVLPKDPR